MRVDELFMQSDQMKSVADHLSLPVQLLLLLQELLGLLYPNAASCGLPVTPGFKKQSQVHLIHAPIRQHI
jgi:hypothetical protein